VVKGDSERRFQFLCEVGYEVMQNAMKGKLTEAMALANRLKEIFDVVYGMLPGVEPAGFGRDISSWLVSRLNSRNAYEVSAVTKA